MRKKKIIALNGGIGNQMFQYAFARMLEFEKNCEVEFDVGFYKKTSDRTVELTKYDTGNYVYKDHVIYNMVRRVFQRIPFLSWVAGTYKEYDQFEVDRRVYKYDYKFYYGYWQNIRYYSDIKNSLRERLRYVGEISEPTQRLKNVIKNSNSVAVHIRRGDYLNGKSIYHILDREYYLKAINRACLELGITDRNELNLYFFSNDIEWCRNNFADLKNAVFVDKSISKSEHIDMMLMKDAKCLIMANSTFSWWSAWLSERPDKIIIAPDRWFCDDNLNNKAKRALIPEEWIIEK